MLNLNVPKGTYVVAVSGGVDSVSLLHALVGTVETNTHKFVVAHFDHGIRADSRADRILAQDLASRYKVPFVYDEGKLGRQASEDVARKARYKFLRQTKKATGASMIITAHHIDDELETAVFNLLRGTNRKGLTALRGSQDILRPMLHIKKRDIVRYAKENKLTWREDETNKDTVYSRNYIRHVLLPRFTEREQATLEGIIQETTKLNQEIDGIIANFLHMQPDTKCIDRMMFNHLPHGVAKEVLAGWLRANGLRRFDAKTIERLVIAIKTGGHQARHDVGGGAKIYLHPNDTAVLEEQG